MRFNFISYFTTFALWRASHILFHLLKYQIRFYMFAALTQRLNCH